MYSSSGLADATAALVAAVESACSGPRSLGTDEADLNELRALLVARKRLEALVADRLLEGAERDLAELEGWPRMSSWAESELLMNRNEINALLRAARVAREMPTTGAMWREGWFSTSHVAAAGDSTAGFTDEQRAQADEFLAREARTDTVPEFAETCQQLRETLVPELVAEELERLRESAHVTLRPVPGGQRISGVVYGEEAEKIAAGLDRFSVPALDDYRDAALRRAEGLALALGIAAQADLSARDLEGTPYSLGDLPRVRVQAVVDVRALQRALDREAELAALRFGDPTGHGETATRPLWFPRSRADLVRGAVGERTRVPIDWQTLLKEFCDGDVQRLVLGPESEVLDLGRRARLFSAAQRQAMLRGRGRCQWRHCDSPWVEADHVTEFSRGGKTAVSDGRMLCGFHHRLRHRGWVLTARDDGTYHATPPPDWAEQRARTAACAYGRRRTRQPRVA